MLNKIMFILALFLVSVTKLLTAPCAQAAGDLQRRGIISIGTMKIQLFAKGRAQISVEKTGLGIPAWPSTQALWGCSNEEVYLQFNWINSINKDCTETCNESAYNGPTKNVDVNFKDCFKQCEPRLLAAYGKRTFNVPLSILFRKSADKKGGYCLLSMNRFDTAPVPGHIVYEFREGFIDANTCFQ